MRTHQQRMLSLGIITSKNGALNFAINCDDGDWNHTFGLPGSCDAVTAWEYRKDINDQLREFRKIYKG